MESHQILDEKVDSKQFNYPRFLERISIAIFIVGLNFKIFHWPYVFEIILSAVILFNIAQILNILKAIKNQTQWKMIFRSLALAFLSISYMLKIFHWKFAKPASYIGLTCITIYFILYLYKKFSKNESH